MNKYLDLAFKMRIFRLSDFVDKTGMTISSASTTLNRWKKAGVVYKIRRDLYCMKNPVVGNIPAAHKFEVACKISDSSFLSYHSALEFHGLGHQIFNVVMVSGETTFRSFTFDECDYQSCITKIGMNGVITSRVNPNVRVTNLERTFVDCIDRVGRAGGAEELFHCFEGLYVLDIEKIKACLELYNKAHLYQKVGYVLEKFKDQIGIQNDIIELCREKGKIAVSNFSTTEKCDVFIKEWNLYIPKIIVKEDEDGLI